MLTVDRRMLTVEVWLKIDKQNSYACKIECNIAKQFTLPKLFRIYFILPKIVLNCITLSEQELWIKCSKYLKCKFIKFDFSCFGCKWKSSKLSVKWDKHTRNFQSKRKCLSVYFFFFSFVK